MNNREINNAKNVLPYRFVKVKGQSKKIKRVNLNKYNDNLYSGELQCSLYGVNPLILGNTHEMEDENNPKSPTRIKPLIVDNKPVISSYTLKGAISNFLSAYIGDPMTRVEKKGFLFRPNMAFAGNKIDVSAGIVWEDEEGDLWVQKIPQPYVFYYDNRNINLNVIHRGSFFNGYSTVINNNRRKRIDEFKQFLHNIQDERFSPSYPTVNIGVINTDNGDKKSSKNLIADFCKIELEIRPVAGQSPEELFFVLLCGFLTLVFL